MELTEQGTVYCNFYHHCGVHWADVWDCMCNDHCPMCNKEITPYYSEEMKPEPHSQPMAH
jgi:hypothetical protein